MKWDPVGQVRHDIFTARLLCVVSVRVYTVIISKYATKIVGTQKRQVACVHGTQDQKQSTFNTFNASSIVKRVKPLEYRSFVLCNASKLQRDCYK